MSDHSRAILSLRWLDVALARIRGARNGSRRRQRSAARREKQRSRWGSPAGARPTGRALRAMKGSLEFERGINEGLGIC